MLRDVKTAGLSVRSGLSPCCKDVSHLCAKPSIHSASTPAEKYNSRRKWGSKNANKTYCRIMRDKSQSSVSSCGRWAVSLGWLALPWAHFPPHVVRATRRLISQPIYMYRCNIGNTSREQCMERAIHGTLPNEMHCPFLLCWFKSRGKMDQMTL